MNGCFLHRSERREHNPAGTRRCSHRTSGEDAALPIESKLPQSRQNPAAYSWRYSSVRDRTACGSPQPVLERLRLALFQHFHEVLTELICEGELLAGLTQLLDLPLLLGSELFFGKHKQLGINSQDQKREECACTSEGCQHCLLTPIQ